MVMKEEKNNKSEEFLHYLQKEGIGILTFGLGCMRVTYFTCPTLPRLNVVFPMRFVLLFFARVF